MQHILGALHSAQILILEGPIANIIKETLAQHHLNAEILDATENIDDKILFNPPDLIIIDIETNAEIIKKIHHIPFIAYCLEENFTKAIEVMRLGAYTCLAKPSNTDEPLNQKALLDAVQHALKFNRKRPDSHSNPLITKSKTMQNLVKTIKTLKNARAMMFIGETGSGKKFLAHYFAKTWNRTAYLIDCENTDIIKTFNTIEYLITQPHNKMFVLNHPQQLGHALQTRLANMIHATIGNNTNQWVNIIDTKDEKNLIKLLHDRISIFRIEIPKMNERVDDIHDIGKIMQKNIASSLNKKMRKLDMHPILQKQWPGNFKQLKTYLEQMFFISSQIDHTEHADILIDEVFTKMPLTEATSLFEKIYLKKQISLKKGKLNEAAIASGVNRTTLYRKLRERIKI